MKYTEQLPMEVLNQFRKDFDHIIDLGECDFLYNDEEYWVVFPVRVINDTKNFESLAIAKYLLDPKTDLIYEAWGRKIMCYCYISDELGGGFNGNGYEPSSKGELIKYYLNYKNA